MIAGCSRRDIQRRIKGPSARPRRMLRGWAQYRAGGTTVLSALELQRRLIDAAIAMASGGTGRARLTSGDHWAISLTRLRERDALRVLQRHGLTRCG